MSPAGSTRVVIAQITSDMFDGSMSSSTITTKRPLRAFALQPSVAIATGIALFDRNHNEERVVDEHALDARNAGGFELLPEHAAVEAHRVMRCARPLRRHVQQNRIVAMIERF